MNNPSLIARRLIYKTVLAVFILILLGDLYHGASNGTMPLILGCAFGLVLLIAIGIWFLIPFHGRP